jgi:hypothetical protein
LVHSAHVVRRQGVLPFTRMNLMERLLMRSIWLVASPIGNKATPQDELA